MPPVPKHAVQARLNTMSKLFEMGSVSEEQELDELRLRKEKGD